MPYTDSSGNYTRSLGKTSLNTGKGNKGVNKPSGKSASPQATKQNGGNYMPASAKAAAGSKGKLNKNMRGENENSREVNAKQKKKYPGKFNQPRGADSKASRKTSVAKKEKNLDSGSFF